MEQPIITTNKWYCYILKNNTYENKTYNGSTNNITRRLRQHNGELVGGAKYTKKYGDNNWHVYFLMTGFIDHKNCLQAEWKIKYPDNKRPRPKKYDGYDGRIKGVNDILNLERWTGNSTIDNSTVNYEIWIIKKYAHLLVEYPNNVAINIIDSEYIDLTTIKN
jgi:predicted GIY-YIG superfamily endonuclease